MAAVAVEGDSIVGDQAADMVRAEAAAKMEVAVGPSADPSSLVARQPAIVTEEVVPVDDVAVEEVVLCLEETLSDGTLA